MLNVLISHSCWTVAILYLSCFIITSASTQSFSYLDKQYFLIKEDKTLDDATTFCRNRGQRLVQIRSEAENDFIFNSMIKSTPRYVWIGATNIMGTKSFVWSDGSAMTYSNWRPGQPNDAIEQHNGIAYLSKTDGMWLDIPASYTYFFICETPSLSARHSKLVKQTDQLNATIEQLDSHLNSVFDNGTKTLRNEYMELIGEVKQSNILVRDKMVQTQIQINSKLDQNYNSNALAIAELSLNLTEVTNFIESSLQSVNETINAKNIATEEKLFNLINSQVVEYSYQDKQYVFIRESNTFFSAIRVCKNRNETLINIGSRSEDEFVFNHIVKPSRHVTWLGATNEIGSNTYKWLDGKELTYSNWNTGFPDKHAEGRNGILMNQSSGQWFDELPTGQGFVICERPTVFALQSTVLEQQSSLLKQAATIKQLEQQFKDASRNLEQSQMDLIKLERQASSMAIELGVQKRQNAELETRLTRQANDAKIELETRLKSIERRIIKN